MTACRTPFHTTQHSRRELARRSSSKSTLVDDEPLQREVNPTAAIYCFVTLIPLPKSHFNSTMPPPQAVFHALLRPAVIQILRATGFHSAKPAVIDSLTDLTSRYLEILCQQTARRTADNALHPDFDGFAEPTIVDVRLALQDVGAFLPERDWEEQDFIEKEDTRGVDEFIAWATGPKIEQMKRVALDEPEEGVTDYLTGMQWLTPQA